MAGIRCRRTRAEATVVVAALSADLDQTRGWNSIWNWSRGYACAICKSLWKRACEVMMGMEVGVGVGMLCGCRPGGREDRQRLHLNLPSIALSCEF